LDDLQEKWWIRILIHQKKREIQMGDGWALLFENHQKSQTASDFLKSMEHDAGIDTISMPSNTCPSTLRHLFFCGPLFGHADREALKERYRPKWYQGATRRRPLFA